MDLIIAMHLRNVMFVFVCFFAMCINGCIHVSMNMVVCMYDCLCMYAFIRV
jgi:hypothetical protein